MLPADITGQVYEQFLSKVIRLAKGDQAKVEEKPEVERAASSTPPPTSSTTSCARRRVKLVEGKRPGPRGGVSKLHRRPGLRLQFLPDRRYQFLLDWHLRIWRTARRSGREINPQIYQTESGEWRLTIVGASAFC